MHTAIWILVMFVSNYRIIKGLPLEVPDPLLSSTSEEVQTIDESDFNNQSDGFSFDEIEEQTASPATEDDTLTILEQTTIAPTSEDDTLTMTEPTLVATPPAENNTLQENKEHKTEENQEGNCVRQNDTGCNLNVDLEATELILPEPNDNMTVVLPETGNKEIKLDDTSKPVSDSTNTFKVEKNIKIKQQDKYKKEEILSKIEKALSKSRTKKVKSAKNSSPTESFPVDMIPIFRQKSFGRGSKSKNANVYNSIRGKSNPYEALKIENIPSTVPNTGVTNKDMPGDMNIENFMTKSTVLRPFVNANNNNFPINQPNVVLNKKSQQTPSIPNQVTLNQAPQRGLNTNNAVSNQALVRTIFNVNNAALSSATQEPIVNLKNVVLHPINQKEILNENLNLRPQLQTTPLNARANNMNAASYTKENNENIKILNFLPVKEKQNDFLNLGCLAEKSLYVASNVKKDVTSKKDDSVIVLMKPETVSLEKVYGNFLKKLTMTVLVPLHVAKLNT